MKYLIALLTAATGLLHLLVGFGVLAGGGDSTNWMLVLNGAGYLVLLVLFWMASGNGGMIRWILLIYTLITLIGYFIIGMGFDGGTIPLVIKAIELLLAILLVLYKGPERVAVQAPAAPAARGYSGGMDTTRAAPTVDTTIGTMASSAGAGATAAAAGAAASVAAMADRAEDAVVDVAEDVGDAAGEAVDYVGDKAEAAYDATADMADEAAEAVGDVVEDVGDGLRGGAVAVGAMADADMESAEDMLGAGADELDADQLAAESTDEELRAELIEYFKSFGSGSEYSKGVEYIEGIGAVYGQKLRDFGVNTVLDLIVSGATRRGRKEISDGSGISQSLILTWVNHVDLFRIKGVAQEYADLLEQSGVDTVMELAQRNPTNLHKRMIDINEQKALVRRLPHASEVQSWVDQAKELRRVIYY